MDRANGLATVGVKKLGVDESKFSTTIQLTRRPTPGAW